MLAKLRFYLGTLVAARRAMVFVLFFWVSMSVIFCLALVRAAARSHACTGGSIESGVSSAQGGPARGARPTLAKNQPHSLTTAF